MAFASDTPTPTPTPTPEESRSARVASLLLTTFLLPAITALLAGLIFGIARFMTMYSLEPGVTWEFFFIGLVPTMAFTAIGLRYALEGSGWPRPLVLVLLLHAALLLPLLPVPYLGWWLADTGRVELAQPISPHADGMSWLLGAYLHVAAVCLVLLLFEFGDHARKRTPGGLGRFRVVSACVALLVVSSVTVPISYALATQDTADHVDQQVALIGDLSHPVALLEAPGWSLCRVWPQPDKERFRVSYRFEDDTRLEVSTEPHDHPLTWCLEEPEQEEREESAESEQERKQEQERKNDRCDQRLVQVPGLMTEDLAQDPRTASEPPALVEVTRSEPVLWLELPGAERMVVLRLWAEPGRLPYDAPDTALVALAEQLVVLDPHDTGAVRELSLRAHLTW